MNFSNFIFLLLGLLSVMSLFLSSETSASEQQRKKGRSQLMLSLFRENNRSAEKSSSNPCL